MAGIGFELKRLFSKKSITSKLMGVFHSVFSTIGHMLIIVALLVAVHFMMLEQSIGSYYKELYSCGILYAFVFPLIFSSGLSIVMSRYLADTIYAQENDKLLPVYYGSSALFLLFAAPVGLVFYILNPVDLWFKVGAYALYIMTGLVFASMTFVSAVKRYKEVSISFFVGITAAGVLSYLVLYHSGLGALNKTRLLIAAFAVGMGIVLIGVMIAVRKRFRTRSKNYFDFLNYIKKFPTLLFYNLLYTLGLYAHNFVFWIFPKTQDRLANFIYSAEYDMATFLGMLTILPATVFFVVGMETRVYDYYRAYLAAVNSATKAAIEKARGDLQRNIRREYVRIIEIQAVVSMLLVVVGVGTLPYVGISAGIIEMYPFLALGYFFSFMMFLTTTLMLYLENHRDALKSSALFLTANILFTTLTAFMGPDFYGLGLIGAGIVSFAASFYKMGATVSNADYILFCSKALKEENRITRFERFSAWLDGKKLG